MHERVVLNPYMGFRPCVSVGKLKSGAFRVIGLQWLLVQFTGGSHWPNLQDGTSVRTLVVTSSAPFCVSWRLKSWTLSAHGADCHRWLTSLVCVSASDWSFIPFLLCLFPLFFPWLFLLGPLLNFHLILYASTKLDFILFTGRVNFCVYLAQISHFARWINFGGLTIQSSYLCAITTISLWLYNSFILELPFHLHHVSQLSSILKRLDVVISQFSIDFYISKATLNL